MGSLDDCVGGDLGPVGTATGVGFDLSELNVESDELVLARNDHKRTGRFTVNSAAHANVWEVGDRYDIWSLSAHAPTTI